MKIIVGVDGSDSSRRAVEWCAEHAPELGGEVVAVHSVDWPLYAVGAFGTVPAPPPGPPDHGPIEGMMQDDWCAPLTKAQVPFRTVVVDGSPAGSIIALAEQEHADLVVTGRRGLGGFKELLLGSTSHELSHHAGCPLVIVP